MFINGSRNYGYGNLKEIHEANCVPSRSYEQLVRYWRWYVNDLTKVKGFVLNYNIKGNMNGLPGKDWYWSDDDDDEDNEEQEDNFNDKVQKNNSADIEGPTNPFLESSNLDIQSKKNDNEKVVPSSGLKDDEINGNQNQNRNNSCRNQGWTEEEHNTVARGIAIYGNDHNKIADLVPARTPGAVQMYIHRHRDSFINPPHENEHLSEDEFGTVYKGKWSMDEHERFAESLLLYSSSFEDMTKFIRTRSLAAVRSYYHRHKRKLLQDSKKYILRETENVQEEPIRKFWTQKDREQLARGIRRYGKDCAKHKEISAAAEYSCHYWTRGEQERLAEGYAIYGKNYNELSKFMKYRSIGGIKGYLQHNLVKIEKSSKKYKREIKEILQCLQMREEGAEEENDEEEEDSSNSQKKNNEYASFTDETHGKLCEAHALYGHDYKTMKGYMQKVLTAEQIEIILKKDSDSFKDESEFNLASPLFLPIELYHILNIAPHEGFDHIISWNWDDKHCKSFKIHDRGTLPHIK